MPAEQWIFHQFQEIHLQNGGLSIVVLLLDVSNSVNGFKIPQCQSRWLASRTLISHSLLLNHPFWEKQVFDPGDQY